MQSRSGLLPGLSMSLGLPTRKKTRTWVDVPAPTYTSPFSSYTRAIRVTVDPTALEPCSGETSTVVADAAMAIEAGLDATGASVKASSAPARPVTSVSIDARRRRGPTRQPLRYGASTSFDGDIRTPVGPEP
jgi:hypothetical protein